MLAQGHVRGACQSAIICIAISWTEELNTREIQCEALRVSVSEIGQLCR